VSEQRRRQKRRSKQTVHERRSKLTVRESGSKPPSESELSGSESVIEQRRRQKRRSKQPGR
jgi:hypothetical protein